MKTNLVSSLKKMSSKLHKIAQVDDPTKDRTSGFFFEGDDLSMTEKDKETQALANADYREWEEHKEKEGRQIAMLELPVDIENTLRRHNIRIVRDLLMIDDKEMSFACGGKEQAQVVNRALEEAGFVPYTDEDREAYNKEQLRAMRENQELANKLYPDVKPSPNLWSSLKKMSSKLRKIAAKRLQFPISDKALKEFKAAIEAKSQFVVQKPLELLRDLLLDDDEPTWFLSHRVFDEYMQGDERFENILFEECGLNAEQLVQAGILRRKAPAHPLKSKPTGRSIAPMTPSSVQSAQTITISVSEDDLKMLNGITGETSYELVKPLEFLKLVFQRWFEQPRMYVEARLGHSPLEDRYEDACDPNPGCDYKDWFRKGILAVPKTKGLPPDMLED